ncbi:MAG: sigma factor-like helix-turn-helix DNA-binding protein [Bryobacteraceae bacterium]|nr:sigma factor-like helix-turn-helix DNA-binding protein [Bryobacteraceae bacterium]
MVHDDAHLPQATLPFVNNLYQFAEAMTGNPADAEKAVVRTYQRLHDSLRSASLESLRPVLFEALMRRLPVTAGWRLLGRLRPSRNTCEFPSILRALRNIPAPARAALLLADVEEFSVTEIASILHVTAAEIPGLLTAARRHLQPPTPPASTVKVATSIPA